MAVICLEHAEDIQLKQLYWCDLAWFKLKKAVYGEFIYHIRFYIILYILYLSICVDGACLLCFARIPCLPAFLSKCTSCNVQTTRLKLSSAGFASRECQGHAAMLNSNEGEKHKRMFYGFHSSMVKHNIQWLLLYQGVPFIMAMAIWWNIISNSHDWWMEQQ